MFSLIMGPAGHDHVVDSVYNCLAMVCLRKVLPALQLQDAGLRVGEVALGLVRRSCRRRVLFLRFRLCGALRFRCNWARFCCLPPYSWRDVCRRWPSLWHCPAPTCPNFTNPTR